MKTKTNLRCENKVAQILFGTAFCATILLTSSCSNDNETALPDGDSRVALQVTSGIQTRAIGNTWQKDDAIGIYMLEAGTTTVSEEARNRRYTATTTGGDAFSAEASETIYFPVDGSKKVDFIAYYPQQVLTDGSLTIDVSSQTDLSKIDLLAAKAQSSEGTPYDKLHPRVDFKFYHKLTKLELNIKNGSGLSEQDLEGLTVEITKQHTAATYTPLTATLSLTTEDMQDVTLNTATDGMTAEAILLPNSTEFNPAIEGRELVFTLNKTKEKFRWTISGEKDFRAGERNIYNITINRSGLTVTATIENWNNGNGTGESGDAE